MKKIKVLFAIICITLMATMTPLASHADDIDVAIDVAPNVINLGSSSTWVTVHTDIAYAVVIATSVVLIVDSYTVFSELCFADERGNLVAKFRMDVVKELFETEVDDLFTFELSGNTNSADNFSGAQDIRVFDNSGQSGGKM
jgi:hypothetical protein